MQGWREGAPYDAIHVGASATTVPTALLDQLARGGRMVLPVGGVGEAQVLRVIDRDAQGRLHEQDMLGVQVSRAGLVNRECSGSACCKRGSAGSWSCGHCGRAIDIPTVWVAQMCPNVWGRGGSALLPTFPGGGRARPPPLAGPPPPPPQSSCSTSVIQWLLLFWSGARCALRCCGRSKIVKNAYCVQYVPLTTKDAQLARIGVPTFAR